MRCFIVKTMRAMLKNSYYEGLLQDLFCGKDGFFPVFLHFFYQKNQIFVFYPDFYEDFSKLSLLEQQTSEKVCELLILLQGDAKYYSSNKQFFSGSGIDYVKKLDAILNYDIELVEKNIIDLKNAYSKIENADIRAGLSEIISVKKEELDILKNCYIKLENMKNEKK